VPHAELAGHGEADDPGADDDDVCTLGRLHRVERRGEPYRYRPPMRARLPLRRAVRGLRSDRANAGRAYARWRRAAEPELRAALHVRRFAAPPLVAGTHVLPEPVAVLETPRELVESRAPWALVVDPGDRLADGAVEAFGRAAALAPDAAVIIADEDRLVRGRRAEPAVRPGPSPDLLATRDLVGKALLVRPDCARDAGVALDGAGWRLALARALTGADGAGAAHAAAVLVHRAGDGAGGGVHPATAPRPAVEGEPTVDVIVPFRDRPELLERSVGSLLRETAWENLRVVLTDNGSVVAPPPALVADPRVAVLRDPRPFNFAALCNGAAAASSAEMLVFLNNDTEIVEPDWLERLVAEAQRPEVGAVAPLLTYPDGSVQHAGVAVGLFGLAGHPFAGLRPDEPTPLGPAAGGVRNCLAVTAACLVVERRKFAAAAGFDEAFVIAGQDVDLGLRLTALGYRSLCVTDVRVIHDEARSRGDRVGAGDPARSEAAYGAFRTLGDPFSNPALTRSSTNCALRMPGEPW
jgi:GT2 family glycosyltransferase